MHYITRSTIIEYKKQLHLSHWRRGGCGARDKKLKWRPKTLEGEVKQASKMAPLTLGGNK